MRLKTVQVHGFKTFAHPTTFHFGDGITAIVGPNGCGKSNIADAIRWALGEQAPSNLRTKKTEDLIFTGSATRPKMGMAEVALTLENPFSFEDDGRTDDGQTDNRRQTTDDETDSAVRRPLSAVVPNGNSPSPVSRPSSIVQEILRARPNEVTLLRRAYRSGENEYLINRQRVRLRDVQELLQRWGLARLTYAVIGQGLVDQALSLRAEERRALFEEAAGVGFYQSKKALALEKLQETEQNLVRVNDIINEIAPRLPSLARQADRASKYESVASALHAHLKQWYAYNWAHAQEGFLSASAQERDAREILSAQRGTIQELASQLTDTRRAAQNLRAKLAEHRRAQQQREMEFAARERELAVIQERVRFAETQHADAQRELETTRALAHSAIAALENFSAPALTLSIDESQNIDEIVDEVMREQNAHAETLLAQQLAELQTLAQKQQAADAAQNSRELELATSETAMETEWQAETDQLIPLQAQTESEERATFERSAQKLEAERAHTEYQRARALAQHRLANLRLHEFDAPAYGTLARDVSIAAFPSPDLAAHLIALQEKLPLYETALASVAALAAQADDLARRERELRERERLLERVRQETNDARTALTLAERDVQTAKQAEANIQREGERAERERRQERERAQRERERERERAREQLAREREKIARERERIQREHEQLVMQRERLTQERARDQERERERARERELERQREMERERERAAREHAQEQERLTRERDRALREQETKNARVETFAAQIAELLSTRDDAQTQVDEMRATLQSLNDVAFPDEAALSEGEQLQNELEEREAELRSGLTVAEELHNRAVLEAERRRAEIARLEQEIEDDLGPVELDSAAPRQLRLRLVGQISNLSPRDPDGQLEKLSNGGQIENLSNDDAPVQELVTLPDVDALPDGFDKEIRRLKNQMRYIGNVNPNAPQEYAELKERHAFLTAQMADLTHAIEKLQQATAELDAMMKQKFIETFNAINAQFKNYFSMLFGGGSARLELTEPNDVIHSGIEITARPPGKRAAQLVLLSGGERALTAAALIFSILKVSPTPFCVMDEVDAALDEANVGRFRAGLTELSTASQFIVITHNRITMEGARAIYGVSMSDDGVSQVLSLKLEEINV